MSQSDIQSAHITADTTAADPDGVCQSQTPAGGGLQALTINGAESSGGVATFTAARFITITSAADETARTFVVTGTDVNGDAQTESITGVDTAAATGTKHFRTVTSVTVDDDTAGAITVGMANNALDVIFEGRLRLRGAFIVNSDTAGVLPFNDGSASGTTRLRLGTVASVVGERDVTIPDMGILFRDGAYIPYTAGTTVFTNITAFYA